jgi:pimeloyl-ACP methyl ester carboxylesterase
VSLLRRGPDPAEFGLEVENVELPGGLAGWFIAHETSTRVLLVCHGRSRSKNHMLPLIARLAEQWNVMAFDFPGHGDNSYGRTTLGWREAAAVGTALDHLEARGFDDIVVYGVSMGGAAALIELGTNPRSSAKALITDGAFADLQGFVLETSGTWLLPGYLMRPCLSAAGKISGYDPGAVKPAAYAESIEVPLLALHGDRDWLVSPESARRIAAAAGECATLRFYAGTHDQPENEEMQQGVMEFTAGLEARPCSP